MTWQNMSIGGVVLQEEPLRKPPMGESPTKDVSMQDLLQVHQEWEQACCSRRIPQRYYACHSIGLLQSHACIGSQFLLTWSRPGTVNTAIEQ